MAKVKVKIICKKCGCEFIHVRDFSSRAEADNYEEWAKENIKICNKCHKHEKENKEVEEALEILKSYPELCELNGTEKQIAWANKIRAKIVSKLAKRSKIPEKTIGNINTIKKADWWIDNRECFEQDWRTAVDRLRKYYTSGE